MAFPFSEYDRGIPYLLQKFFSKVRRIRIANKDRVSEDAKSRD